MPESLGVIKKKEAGVSGYGGGGYDIPKPPASPIQYPVGGGGQARGAQVPQYSYPSMSYNPTPTSQSILAAGGQVSSANAGNNIFGSPQISQSYQLPLAGYGNPTPSQQANSDLYKKAIEGLTSAGSYQQSYGGGTPGKGPERVPFPNAPVNQAGAAAAAAQNAAMGQAKAQAGSLGKSAVDTLRAQLAERGILGGGTEARGLVDRLAAATNPLSDLNVAGLRENVGIATHNFDTANQNALANYSGDINQRGQDISLQENQEDNAARQQAQKQQLILQALSGLSRLY